MVEPESEGGQSQRRRVAAAVAGVAGAIVVVVAVLNQHWFGAATAVIITVILLLGLRSRPMRLVFVVGQQERHQVVFRFDKFWGNLSITVDGRPAVRDLRLFSVSLTKIYRFSVGDREVHAVRIEKDRALAFAGARPQPVRAYVDDVLTAQGVA